MNRDNLLEALKICKPALGNSSLIPGLDAYHFQGKRVTAFNGSLLVSTELETDFPIVGSIIGDTLFKLVSELDKDIEITIPTTTSIMVKSGRSKTTFPVSQIDPVFLEAAEEHEGEIHLPTSVLFASGLKRCLQSVSTKSSMSDEVGINVFIENGECRMYSSNGVLFSRFVFPLEGGNFPDIQIFLPAAFCEQLLYLYSELRIEPSEITITDKYIRALFGNVYLRCSFYSSPVKMEVRQLIDDGLEVIPTVPLPKELSETIKRSEIIAGNAVVTLNYDHDKVVATAKGRGSQELKEEVDLPYPLEGSITIDVRNTKRLLDSSKAIGFTNKFIVLVGHEGYYNQIIAGKDITNG
jgi:DNA polymerase III sliding clamp (beta) subunit (PCNA family)